MAGVEPIQVPIEFEVHPEVKARMDALELTQKRQEADIVHWKGVAKDAAAVAIGVRKAMQTHRFRGGSLIRNILVLGGLASLGVGCWWILPAASLIVVGGITLGLVVFGAMARQKMERERVRSDI